ncbi:MAG: hypothetical protein WDN69_23260 [Aliidongia sp.]
MRPFNSRFFSAGGGTWEKKGALGRLAGRADLPFQHREGCRLRALQHPIFGRLAQRLPGRGRAIGGTGIMWQAGNDQVAYPVLQYDLVRLRAAGFGRSNGTRCGSAGAVKTGIGLVLRGWEKADGFVFNAGRSDQNRRLRNGRAALDRLCRRVAAAWSWSSSPA